MAFNNADGCLHLILRTWASLAATQYRLRTFPVTQNLGMPHGCVLGHFLSSVYINCIGDFIQPHLSVYQQYAGGSKFKHCPVAIPAQHIRTELLVSHKPLNSTACLIQKPCGHPWFLSHTCHIQHLWKTYWL